MLARESKKAFEDFLARDSTMPLGDGTAPAAGDAKVIFRTPLDEYDALIHLKHGALPRIAQNIDFRPKVGRRGGGEHTCSFSCALI